MAHDVLDTVVAAETPEGISLELRPAGLSARFSAVLLDWLIRLVIAYAAAIAAALMGGFGVEPGVYGAAVAPAMVAPTLSHVLKVARPSGADEALLPGLQGVR